MSKHDIQEMTGVIRRDDDGQEVVITEEGWIVPVVGTLTANTTPEDFRRFERLAAAWWEKFNKRTGDRRQEDGEELDHGYQGYPS